MDIEPRLSTAMVTLLGTFSHEKLTPSWFAKRDLLPQRMIDSAKVYAGDGTTGFVSDWLRFTAAPERISAETAQAPYVRICDFVLRTFHEHLYRSVSLEGFVIHRGSMYPLEAEQAFDNIARSVVPFAEWTNPATGQRTSGDPTPVVVTQQQGDVWVILQLQGASTPPAIGVSVAEMHHAKSKSGGQDASRDLTRMLGKRFDGAVRRADALIRRVMAHHSRRPD